MSKKLKINGKEITFPSYISILQNVSIFNHKCIIACGVHSDGTLLIVTNEGTIKEIKPNGKLIPTYAVPLKDGECIEVKFKGKSTPKILISELVIAAAKDCLLEGDFYMGNTYIGNFEISQDTEYNENNCSGVEKNNI